MRYNKLHDDGDRLFPDYNRHFPEFYSFIPSDEQNDMNELHFAILGVNGPVFELRIPHDGSGPKKYTSTLWDVWQEDRAVRLKEVTWEESAWSDYYHRSNISY